LSYSLAFSQAIFATLYIADKVQQGFGEFIPTRQVAEDLNIPGPSASKILRLLNLAGILETREGVKGGVRLAVEPEDVTLLDIFVAVEQERPLFHRDVELRVGGDRPMRAQQAIFDALGRSEEAMKASLEEVSIAELIKILSNN